MRKLSLFLALALLCLAIAATLTWTNRSTILAHFMSRQLRVPVTIRALDLSKTSSAISRLWVGNFPGSKSSTSFTAESIRMQAALEQIFEDPMTIEAIDIDDIFVGIEYYQGGDTNWSRILQSKVPKKKKPRDYLIRTLTLRNLTVQVMQADGKVKRYPTIKQMEFHNITSETGFPVEEIEKAIFDLMMKDLMRKLPIDQLFRGINPLPFPFMK